MDSTSLLIYKAFECLNFEFDGFKDNLNQRIIFQKYGLLFEKIFALKKGSYSLYVYGPYNSTLSDLGYDISKNYEQYSEESKNITFKTQTVEIIHELKEIFPINPNLENRKKLEIYATYLYLISEHKYSENSEKLKSSLERLKGSIMDDFGYDDVVRTHAVLRPYLKFI